MSRLLLNKTARKLIKMQRRENVIELPDQYDDPSSSDSAPNYSDGEQTQKFLEKLAKEIDADAENDSILALRNGVFARDGLSKVKRQQAIDATAVASNSSIAYQLKATDRSRQPLTMRSASGAQENHTILDPSKGEYQ